MMVKWLGFAVAAFIATGVHAQSADSGADPSQQAPTPAMRSMPSRPSGPSGPSVPGSAVSTADNAGMGLGQDRSIGGSGSAGLAAMGGDAGPATNEMGAGAMTECPMGMFRKLGLCVPYGTRK